MSMPTAPFGVAQLDGLELQRHHSIAATIHRAVDLGEVRKALDRLQTLGMPREQAALFHAQADALHAMLLTENNRLHSKKVRP